MDWLALMNAAQPEIAAKFPVTRRYFAQGFKVSPRFHADDIVGLETLNQTIRLNLITGDLELV